MSTLLKEKRCNNLSSAKQFLRVLGTVKSKWSLLQKSGATFYSQEIIVYVLYEKDSQRYSKSLSTLDARDLLAPAARSVKSTLFLISLTVTHLILWKMHDSIFVLSQKWPY